MFGVDPTGDREEFLGLRREHLNKRLHVVTDGATAEVLADARDRQKRGEDPYRITGRPRKPANTKHLETPGAVVTEGFRGWFGGKYVTWFGVKHVV
jgi:hypothetical protein